MREFFTIVLVCFCATSEAEKGCSKLSLSCSCRRNDMTGEYVQTEAMVEGRSVYIRQANMQTYYMFYDTGKWQIETKYKRLVAVKEDMAMEPQDIRGPWAVRPWLGDWKRKELTIRCQSEGHNMKWLLIIIVLLASLLIISGITICAYKLFQAVKRSENRNTIAAPDLRRTPSSPPPYTINVQAQALPEKSFPDAMAPDCPPYIPGEQCSAPPSYDEVITSQ